MPNYNGNDPRLTEIRRNITLLQRRIQKFRLPSRQRVRLKEPYYPWSPSPHSSPVRGCVAIPFMVREPHHERYCMIANSSIYPFALSSSKGSERIATRTALMLVMLPPSGSNQTNSTCPALACATTSPGRRPLPCLGFHTSPQSGDRSPACGDLHFLRLFRQVINHLL
jgi:hypothetical protein